jgi:calcineurin-like phosphoesterase family protein
MKKKLTLEAGQNVYFFSDPHYAHVNICRGTTNWPNADDETRDFPTVEAMNDKIVNNINNFAAENDWLVCAGDWSFSGFKKIKEFRDQIHCKNIILVLGNHDEKIEKNQEGVQGLFSMVCEYLELTVKRDNASDLFIISHYPMASWNFMNKGAIHLHGHVHHSKDIRLGPGKMLDIGVEGNDFKPYGLPYILELMKHQPIKGLFNYDHHLNPR